MKEIRRQLTKLEKSILGECGFEEAVQRSINIRLDLEDFIKDSLKQAMEGKELP